MKFKRLLSSILCAVMLVGTLTVSASAAELKSFSDVPSSHWAHDAIMKMVGMGMFAGTTAPDANGVGTFAPTAPMTRAQFVTVVTRYLYDAELKAVAPDYEGSEYWFEANYDVAVDHGIIKESEFSKEDMKTPMTRQEMAMVLVRAAAEKGEHAEKLVHTQRIADYGKVGNYYKDYVRQCYSMGMICGTDSKGTFNPNGTLNRAQAATVLYRLVDAGSRQQVDLSAPQAEVQQQAGAITIKEGQQSSRPAKAGDTYVKADGTKVVLKVGPNGILGEGQGVAPDANLQVGNSSWTGNRFNFTASEVGNLTDSLGNTLQNQKYLVNRTTGEGHWNMEWAALEKVYPAPKENGTTPGQVSSDPYSMYMWSPIVGWVANYR